MRLEKVDTPASCLPSSTDDDLCFPVGSLRFYVTREEGGGIGGQKQRVFWEAVEPEYSGSLSP